MARYELTQLGAFHMVENPDEWEPQRTNNFEVQIYGLETLRSVHQKIKLPSNAGEILTLSTVSVGQINTNVGVIPIPYGNTRVKFAGIPNITDVDIVFNDYIGKDTERIIAAWHALVFNPLTQKIGRASEYKKDGVLIETAPDGSRGRAWQLKGCWPSNVQYGGYSNEGGAQRQITVVLTYDIAIPMDN